jgi:phosphoribosyl 1,2-cyclic phosphate phosphodiesterase
LRKIFAMLITVLGSGTSQGVPVIGCQCPVCQSKDPRDKRTRTSILIRTDQVTVAVDAGPDFRQQMLREGIDHLDAVFITHEHKDHIGGLDDVRPFIFNQSNKPMPLFVDKTALPEIKREFSYAFKEHLYPGAPTYEVHLIDETPFDFGDLHVEPIKLKHYTLTSYAFRIGKFAYVTDFNEISKKALQRLEGVEYLIIEALGRRKHYSHINLDQAVEIAIQLKVKKAWFTHCSHHMGKAVDVNAELPDNMMLAYDGLNILINDE